MFYFYLLSYVYVIITCFYYLILFMVRARVRAQPCPMCGGRGAVRPSGRGAVRRGPPREGRAHGAKPGPGAAHEGLNTKGKIIDL